MACLYSDKVRHDKEDDPNHVAYKKIPDGNHTACDLLRTRGFRGNKLKVHLKESMLTAGTAQILASMLLSLVSANPNLSLDSSLDEANNPPNSKANAPILNQIILIWMRRLFQPSLGCS